VQVRPERDAEALGPVVVFALRWQRNLHAAGAALDQEGGLGVLRLEAAAVGTWRGGGGGGVRPHTYVRYLLPPSVTEWVDVSGWRGGCVCEAAPPIAPPSRWRAI